MSLNIFTTCSPTCMVNMYLYRNSLRTIQIVSYGYYLKYFNENFNMTFGYPRADTCGTCDALKVQIESATDAQKMTLQVQKEDHLRRAENFYASLGTNTKLAKIMLTLQQFLLTSNKISLYPTSLQEKYSTCTSSGCMSSG